MGENYLTNLTSRKKNGLFDTV